MCIMSSTTPMSPMATTRMKLPTIFGVNPFTLAHPSRPARGLRSKPARCVAVDDGTRHGRADGAGCGARRAGNRRRDPPGRRSGLRGRPRPGRAHAAGAGARRSNGDDDIAAIAAVHALAEIFDEQAARMLSALLSDDRPAIREHAAWALGSGASALRCDGPTDRPGRRRRLHRDARAADAREVVDGGAGAPGGRASRAHCWPWTEPAARARLVETLGLVRPAIATRVLLAVARDASRSPRRCAWRRSPPWVSDPAPRESANSSKSSSVGDGHLARGGQTRPHRPRAGGNLAHSTRGVGLTVRAAVPARRHRPHSRRRRRR